MAGISKTKRFNFSAKSPQSLPTITGPQDMTSALKIWQARLAPAIKTSLPPPTPLNFKVTSVRGGLQLSWSPVQDTSLGSPDGYVITRSKDGTFTDDVATIPLPGSSQAGYFDSLGGSATTISYRLQTASGTATYPQSKVGPPSGVVSHTSIDITDNVTQPSARFDNFTTDKTRAGARTGFYGLQQYQTALGGTGGAQSGTGGGSETSGGSGGGSIPPPAASAITFDQIGTGVNTTASMFVGFGASIVPSGGTVEANNINGLAVVNPPTGPGLALIVDPGEASASWSARIQVNGAAASFDAVIYVNGVPVIDNFFVNGKLSSSNISAGISINGTPV